jgi:hypothetical protein
MSKKQNFTFIGPKNYSINNNTKVDDSIDDVLITDEDGDNFYLKGSSTIIAKSIITYILEMRRFGAIGLKFSIFDFDFNADGSIDLKQSKGNITSDGIRVISEIQRLLRLKAFW